MRLWNSTIELPKLQHVQETQVDPPWLVKVFNNEHNTYQEVMVILMLATDCDEDEAYIETWEIDHLGSSIVHSADETECQRVAEVISTIGIRVEVYQEL